MPYPLPLDLDAANVALARISERAISSFNENSPAARAIARLYSPCRNLMFSAMDWRFATARAQLGEQVAGAYPWAYQYAMPDGVARVRMVLPGVDGEGSGYGDPAPFEEGVGPVGVVVRRVIRTDISRAVLVYTALLEDPNLWDDGFFSAFTVQLAAEITLPITGNGQLAQSMRQQAVQSLQAQMPVGQAQSITPQSRGPSTTTAARDA